MDETDNRPEPPAVGAEPAMTETEADRRAAVQRLIGMAAIGPLAALLFDPEAAHAYP